MLGVCAVRNTRDRHSPKLTRSENPDARGDHAEPGRDDANAARDYDDSRSYDCHATSYDHPQHRS
jgi:hypothetical protein